jgi:Domain of unknown function (DUF4386)
VFLCWLLLRTRLIPRPLAILGLIGYPILAARTIAELFGIHIGLLLTIPGGLFELALAFWLLFKGFNPEAYGQVRDHQVRRAAAGHRIVPAHGRRKQRCLTTPPARWPARPCW